MSESEELLVALRDVGLTTPRDGDAGDVRVRTSVQREIAGRPRRSRPRLRMPSGLTPRTAGFATAAFAATATAAGVVVATGALAGPGTPQIAFPNPHAASPGSAQVQDTAYVIRRIGESVAQGGTVVEQAVYRHGEVRADGSLAGLRWKMEDGYTYAAPSGRASGQARMYYSDGSLEEVYGQVATPRARGRWSTVETDVNPNVREYSRERYAGNPVEPTGSHDPNLFSTPAQVRRALHTDTVKVRGTVTIDGTPAIVLSMTQPNAPGSPSNHIALYVDAQTYQPLRSAEDTGRGSDLWVGVWRPATRANIARARLSVPTGYTRVSGAAVARSTYRRH